MNLFFIFFSDIVNIFGNLNFKIVGFKYFKFKNFHATKVSRRKGVYLVPLVPLLLGNWLSRNVLRWDVLAVRKAESFTYCHKTSNNNNTNGHSLERAFEIFLIWLPQWEHLIFYIEMPQMHSNFNIFNCSLPDSAFESTTSI